MIRSELIDELRHLEHTSNLLPEQNKRLLAIIQELHKCICRKCRKIYKEDKSRAEYKGYCSAKCQHERACELGFRKTQNKTEYDTLVRAKAVGSDYVIK